MPICMGAMGYPCTGTAIGTAIGTAMTGMPIMLIRFMFMFMFGDMPIIGFAIHICDGEVTLGLGIDDVRSRPPTMLSAMDERLPAPRLELALRSRGRTSGADDERLFGAREPGGGGAGYEYPDESR